MRAQGLPQPCIIPLPKATSAAQRPSFQDSAQHSNTPITAASRHASEAPAALAMARLPQPLSDTNLAAHDAALGGHSARRQQPVSELERLPSLSGDGSVTGSVISQSGDRPLFTSLHMRASCPSFQIAPLLLLYTSHRIGLIKEYGLQFFQIIAVVDESNMASICWFYRMNS